MAKNHVDSGKTVTYTNTGSAVIYSGSVVVIGEKIAVSLGDIQVGGKGTLFTEEVFKLPKDTGAAMNLGDSVYWDTANKKIVAASGTDTVPAGMVAADATANAATVNVKLNA